MQLYDNTLREGEQSIGISFNKEEKLDIVKALIDIGIKNIEVGFIAVSEYEQESIKNILSHDFNANLFSLSRMLQSDIDLAHKCGLKNITVFTSSSDLLMKYKLKKSEDQVNEEIKQTISYCKEKGMYVRFSCEDATQTPVERLIRFYNTAYEYGADYASVPDTCGVATPNSMYRLIKDLKANVRIPVSVHTHNDFGLAVGNSVMGYLAGADELQATVNGFGERAGNCSLIEIIMILKQLYSVDLGIKLDKLVSLSRLVEKYSNQDLPNNYPVTGKYVFSYQSGLHVALLKHDKKCYTPFPPEMIGRKHEIIFGKQAGKSNIELLCDEMRIELSESEMIHVLDQVKIKASSGEAIVPQIEVRKLIEQEFQKK